MFFLLCMCHLCACVPFFFSFCSPSMGGGVVPSGYYDYFLFFSFFFFVVAAVSLFYCILPPFVC